MIVKGNPLLVGATGKLRNLVVKKYGDKIVISTVPDMSRRKLSPKQIAANERMQSAIYCAKYMCANPVLKQRACEQLQVPPNKVFRAIVKEFLLTDGRGGIFEESEREIADNKTLKTLETTIVNELPEAEVKQFGTRATGVPTPQSDWDLLVLTPNEPTAKKKWELQEKLFAITVHQGTRVNMLLVQKDKWLTAPEYEILRKRITAELPPVKVIPL